MTPNLAESKLARVGLLCLYNHKKNPSKTILQIQRCHSCAYNVSWHIHHNDLEILTGSACRTLGAVISHAIHSPLSALTFRFAFYLKNGSSSWCTAFDALSHFAVKCDTFCTAPEFFQMGVISHQISWTSFNRAWKFSSENMDELKRWLFKDIMFA